MAFGDVASLVRCAGSDTWAWLTPGARGPPGALVRSDLQSWLLRRANASGPQPTSAPHGAGQRALAATPSHALGGDVDPTLRFPKLRVLGLPAPLRSLGQKESGCNSRRRKKLRLERECRVCRGSLRSPPALASTLNLQCPGLHRRLRQHSARDWAGGAGISTVNLC